MSDSLQTDIAAVLAKHGVSGLPPQAKAAPVEGVKIGPGAAASYIKEIITSDREFDEQILSRVANLLGARR